MSELECKLEDKIYDWADTKCWLDEGDIPSICADTNSIFTYWECTEVELDSADNGEYAFTTKITIHGEPRKDDAPFCGDTIFVKVKGRIYYDEEDWCIDDAYDVSAELEDWYEPKHIIAQRFFDCADELLVAISELPTQLWYRGHANECWKLNTTIARQSNPSVALERMLRLEFENQTTFLDPTLHPLGIGKCNLLMRHHGLPARLLDWTTSPLAAMYFAVCDDKEDNVDACIWQLDPSKLNHFYGELFPLECDGKEEELYTEKSDKTLALHAPHISLRMRMQRSEFTLHTHYQAIEDDVSASVFLKEKFIISKKIKSVLRQKLSALGIDRSFLFPDLDNIAKTIGDNILEDSK